MKKLLIISLIILSLILIGCKNNKITGGTTIATDKVIEKCEDSDGGIDKEIKGIISVGEETYADSCVAGLLIEYYCDGDKAVNQNMRCANKCINGKCN